MIALIKKRYRIVRVRNHYQVEKLHWLFYIIPYWYTWSDSDGETIYPYKYKTISEAETAIKKCNEYQKIKGVVKTILIA